jgi:K+-transporting ATPase KdpF subunit
VGGIMNVVVIVATVIVFVYLVYAMLRPERF